jgi:hypothetical protein
MHSGRMCYASRLWALAGLLVLVRAAKNRDDGRDVMSELRRSVKPTLDSTGKIMTYTRNFVRNDVPDTGEYTHLVYNISRPTGYFITLKHFGVKSVTCTPESTTIEMASSEDGQKLVAALLNSSSGLLYGSDAWGCVSSRCAS